MFITRETYDSLILRNARLEEQVSHLGQMLDKAEGVIALLQSQVERERTRAENATDNLLTHVAKVSPITERSTDLPDPDQMFEEDDRELATLRKDIDHQGIAAVLEEELTGSKYHDATGEGGVISSTFEP